VAVGETLDQLPRCHVQVWRGQDKPVQWLWLSRVRNAAAHTFMRRESGWPMPPVGMRKGGHPHHHSTLNRCQLKDMKGI
jgi:hypothetical protein